MENLQTTQKKIAKSVDSAIKEIIIQSVSKKHHDIIKYTIGVGGKRLRPVLAIICCQMMGGSMRDSLYPAAALEILHNYTLIVDDIIDHSEFRRKKPTAWKKFGNSIAECIAVSYAASIFDIANKCKNLQRCNSTLTKALKTVADGEILDILFEQSGREDEKYVTKNRYLQITLRDYNEMAMKKTASLFSACAEIGGICANATEGKIKLLKDFGHNIGIAFQIQDDILDIYGDERKTGKKVGRDLIERKMGNIVILLAMKEFSLTEKKNFLSILRKKKISNQDIKKGVNLIKKTEALDNAHKLGIKYIRKAKLSLAKLPQNKWNKLLGELSDYLVKRNS